MIRDSNGLQALETPPETMTESSCPPHKRAQARETGEGFAGEEGVYVYVKKI